MEDIEVSAEELCQLFSDTERRQLIVVLLEAERYVPLTTLVERVSESLDVPSSHTDMQEFCKALRLRFHHVHLPLFADIGVVEYNPDQHLARSTSELEAVAEHLDVEPRMVVAN